MASQIERIALWREGSPEGSVLSINLQTLAKKKNTKNHKPPKHTLPVTIRIHFHHSYPRDYCKLWYRNEEVS